MLETREHINAEHLSRCAELRLEGYRGLLVKRGDRHRLNSPISMYYRRFIRTPTDDEQHELQRMTQQENPIEDLWRHLKRIVAANLERDLDALKVACYRFFERLSKDDILRMTGLAT